MTYKFADSIAFLNKTEGIDFSLKRIISLTLALLTLVSFIPASVFAEQLSDETWNNKAFHADQDEAPKITYQKAYSYLAEYPDQASGDYAVGSVNSPRPAMLNADNYPEGNTTVETWKATSQSPYFAVSYKMYVPSTIQSIHGNCWHASNLPSGTTLGGTDQGYYYPLREDDAYRSHNHSTQSPRMGITLGLVNQYLPYETFEGLGYTYGFFGFSYERDTGKSTGTLSQYNTPTLLFGPNGEEQDQSISSFPGDHRWKSPFYDKRVEHPINAVPVIDKNGSTVKMDFSDQEVVIMLVGSYINKQVKLKAYINGYQIAETWDHKSEFTFTDVTRTDVVQWADRDHKYKQEFGGQVGFVNELHGNLAWARFTRSSHTLDQNAFNIHHAKVDASRPNDNNNNYFYDQANQWRVDMKHFAASYTIDIPTGELSFYDNTEYNGANELNGTDAKKYSSLNCGLVLGRESRNPGLLKATIDFRFTETGTNKCKWDENSRLIFGPDNFYNTADKGISTEMNWRDKKKGIKLSTGKHTILIVGDYDETAQTVKLTAWLDGTKIKSWFDQYENTMKCFGEDVKLYNLGDRNYVGWRTNVKGVNAVARFTQWDEDANMDYAAKNGTVFDLKTAGPMTGYWDREVTQNALTWGADATDKFDAVAFTPYNEAWEGYEHPNNNAYQLGMITDPSRSFVVQADISYKNFKGFYITPEEPTDNTNDRLNIGFSDGKMDDIRKWYNKYYYIQLRHTSEGEGHITTFINTGDGEPAEYKWIVPDVCVGSDTLRVQNVLSPVSDSGTEYIGVRVVYSNRKLSVYVKEGGQSNHTSQYTFLYEITNLDNPTVIDDNHKNDSRTSYSILQGHDGPLYFGLMTKSGENSKTGNTGVTFRNVKVSYGLQSPEEIHANIKNDNQLMPGVVVMSANTAAQVGSRNNNVAGFAQTRSSQTAGKYDLRVAVEGGELGLYRAENYDAVIRVQMQNEDGSSQKMITSFSHHWAYREFSFYDAEYYFHANGSDNYGLICAVFTNIPETYTDYYVYVDFYERGQTKLTKENCKVSVYLGSGYYSPANNTLHGAGGFAAPASKNGTTNVDKKLDNGGLSVRNDLYKCFPTYYGR